MQNVMLRKLSFYGMNCSFNNLCCYKVLRCVVLTVAKIFSFVSAFTDSLSIRQTERHKIYESAKMRKQQH